MHKKLRIYMDHAAATPLERAAKLAMQPYLDDEFANPSSLYSAARSARRAVEEARARTARVLGAKPTEIVWTSGGTESVNLAVQGVLNANPGAHWVTSAIEHESVLRIRKPYDERGHAVSTVPVGPNGIADANDVTKAVNDSTCLVSIMLANNEIGTIQPIAAIRKLLESIRADRARRGVHMPLLLHSDACQASPYLDLHTTRLGVDLLSINGSKCHGPKGVGLLYVKTGTILVPLQFGGGQERGRRSGTENVAGIVGFAVALDRAQIDRHVESDRLAELRSELIEGLLAISDTSLNGDPSRRLPNNVNVTVDGVEGQSLVLYLDEAGIMASTGSACSTGDLDPSHVLLAIGRSREQASSSLRLTMGRSTTKADVAAVLQEVARIVRRLRELT